MPVIIPKGLPAIDILKKESVFVMGEARARSQDIRPIKVCIINLMPTKIKTETQLIRMLSNTALQIDIDLVKTERESKNTSKEHLDRFYKTFEQIRFNKYDAMIITGAPVERIHYTEVDYWDELTQIMDFARENVYSTMFICWAAQAALFHYYGIKKRNADKKIFGVFKNELVGESPITRGFDEEFYAPQSRYTYCKEEDINNAKDLIVLAKSKEAGVHIAASKDSRLLFVFGHSEYDRDTLDLEYKRDISKGLDTDIPVNYYENNLPNSKVIARWKSTGNLLFSNWLNYCVYQSTPYNINEIQKKVVSKFGGSSLSDSVQFNKVKSIVMAEKERSHIVVSAPGKRSPEDQKITDILNSCYELQLKKKNLEYEELRIKNEKMKLENKLDSTIYMVENRFEELCEELNLRDEIRKELARVKVEIKASVDRDFILSRGEYLNAIIMAEYLGYEFIDAKELIYFDENGDINEQKTYESIHERVKSKKVVIPGFYGIDYKGNIKTFERGGSDITGSILARGIGADLYENWSDVSGVMTADPRKDKNAKPISEMTYDELQKMSEAGANVYHKDAITPVEKVRIPINIKNTNIPEDKGTVIKNEKKD